LDLGSSEPFDDLHGSATLGAAIKICSVFRRGGVFFGRWFWGCAQQLKAERQKGGASAVGQEAEMSNTHEALRKVVQQKTDQEFIDGQGQEFLFVAVSGIAPTKGDLAIGKGDQAVVGDGHAMGVAADQTPKPYKCPSRRHFSGSRKLSIRVRRELNLGPD
jgi:hypothetical protein